MAHSSTNKFGMNISTCDIHRRIPRVYLNRNADFKHCEIKEINKDECFKPFKLYNKSNGSKKGFSENDSDSGDDRGIDVKKNETDFNEFMEYDLQILDELVQKENFENNNSGKWKEDSCSFVIKRKECNTDEGESSGDEDSSRSPFTHIFNDAYIKEKTGEDDNYKRLKRINKKKNNDLVDMTVLKNILNLYFLFDLKNEGYIDLKHAALIVQNIYENNTKYLLEHIHLNWNKKDKEDKEKNSEKNDWGMKKSSTRINVKEEIIKTFCVKKFGKFLLIILHDVSVVPKQHGVLEKKDFIHMMYQFIKKNDQSDNIYRTLLYPHNILTSFYEYLNYLFTIEENKKEMKKLSLNSKKKLNNMPNVDKAFVNSNLRCHVDHYKKRKEKKIEMLKIGKEENEMKECVFVPNITPTPQYLLKQKYNRHLKNMQNTCEEKQKTTTEHKHITYDIDTSIKRTLMLPNSFILEKVSNKIELIPLGEKPVKLKYIIHQNYRPFPRLSWVDTLKNTPVKSIHELLKNDKHKNGTTGTTSLKKTASIKGITSTKSIPSPKSNNEAQKKAKTKAENISNVPNTNMKINIDEKTYSPQNNKNVKKKINPKVLTFSNKKEKTNINDSDIFNFSNKNEKHEMLTFEIPPLRNISYKKFNVINTSFIDPIISNAEKKKT